MTTHTVVDGDTFESISSKSYGSPTEVDLIQSANPHSEGGLTIGMVLNIPANPLLPVLPGTSPATRENEVSINLDGKIFRFWESMVIERSMTQFDRFSLSAPFISSAQAFRDAFIPMSFQRVEVFVGGALLFTGFNVENVPAASIQATTVSAAGYSLSGVLNDCPLPGTTFPNEDDSFTLREIATEQCRPFGLVPVFTADAGAAFDRVAIRVDQAILDFWTGLAGQRRLVIGNDEMGQPIFQQETLEPAIQLLQHGVSPVTNVEARLRPQEFFSHVTAIIPSTTGKKGTQQTVANPFLQGILRPLTFTARDVLPGGELEAAEAKMGRMFANAIQYRVDVAGWRNVLGQLWAPNTKYRLLAPDAMIYNETEFLLRSVRLRRDANEDTASLQFVLPGAFTGQIPETLPWLE